MRVCAEFEDHFKALAAHKHLVDEGLDPMEIEIRSPYPLPEHPIPPHRVSPMHMRPVVRTMWAVALTLGFSFVTYTQYEWAPVSVTNGHPLIPVPITMLPTYECGMITGILTTTFMFFLETFRYRDLVPPLEEDMPVAIGYVALVVGGRSADRATSLLEGRGARSVVSYLIMFMMLTFLSGCAQFNQRQQDVIKTTEKAQEFGPMHSIRMPSNAEQAVAPPPAIGYNQVGDQEQFDTMRSKQAETLRRYYETNEAEKAKMGEAATAGQNARAEMIRLGTYPKMWALKEDGTVAAKCAPWKNPVKPTAEALQRGANLFKSNCSGCHGLEGKGDGLVGQLSEVPPPPIGTAGKYPNHTQGDGYFYYYIYVGKNNMPSFGYKLTPEEIADIILHLRDLQKKNG